MVSHIIHYTKIFFSSSSPINCFFPVLLDTKVLFFFFFEILHTKVRFSVAALFLHGGFCSFGQWWADLTQLTQSLRRDHSEFSRNQSLEIIRRRSWMTQSAPSWLGGRQPEELDVAKNTHRSSIWQRTSLQILRNKHVIRKSTFFCLVFFCLFKSTNLRNRTNTHSNEGPMQANDTTLRSTSDFSSPQPQESSIATQTGIQSRAGDVSCRQAFKTGPLSGKTPQSEAAAAAWPRTPATVYKLMWESRKNKRGRKQVVGQPTKQTKKKPKTLWTLKCHVICQLKYKNIWFKK